MSNKEYEILEALDLILKIDSVQALLYQIVDCTANELENNESLSITKDISLKDFDCKLPDEINLCRIFALKANSKSKIERHSNSVQRTKTLKGSGNIEIFDSVETLKFNNWVVVKENTWHRPVTNGEDWITITFHTAKAEDIIDEYKN